MIVILDLMILTIYIEYNIGIDYHHIMNRNKYRHIKRKKSSNKSSDCNTRFDDTYRLYKYKTGIDYHHIKQTNEERHGKKEQGKSWRIKVVIVIIDFMILTFYIEYNIGIDYHHIMTEMKRNIQKI